MSLDDNDINDLYLCELHNSGQKTLTELLDANDLVDAIQVGDDI